MLLDSQDPTARLSAENCKECNPQLLNLPPAECPSSRQARSQASAVCLSRLLHRQFGQSPNFRLKFPFGLSCLNSQNGRVSSAKASRLWKTLLSLEMKATVIK